MDSLVDLAKSHPFITAFVGLLAGLAGKWVASRPAMQALKLSILQDAREESNKTEALINERIDQIAEDLREARALYKELRVEHDELRAAHSALQEELTAERIKSRELEAEVKRLEKRLSEAESLKPHHEA